MLDLVHNGPVRGPAFFEGSGLVTRLRERLQHTNVLLVAPRKLGKTSTLYRLLDEPGELPFRPLYLDVGHLENAADLIVELIAALLLSPYFTGVARQLWAPVGEFGQWVRDLPDDVDPGDLKIALREKTTLRENWAHYGDDLMTLLSREAPPLLLLVDNLSGPVRAMAREGRDTVTEFLRWFRAVRVQHKTYVRFLLSGSVDLISRLEGLKQIDTINDLWIENVEPWPDDVALSFVTEIFAARGVPYEESVPRTLLDLLGAPIPALLTVLLDAALARQRALRKPLSERWVHQTFREDVLGGVGAPIFQSFADGLSSYREWEARCARALLGLLARSEKPLSRGHLFRVFLQESRFDPSTRSSTEFVRLLARLENDFYISSQGETYVFFSRMLRLGWKARYGFQL